MLEVISRGGLAVAVLAEAIPPAEDLEDLAADFPVVAVLLVLGKYNSLNPPYQGDFLLVPPLTRGG